MRLIKFIGANGNEYFVSDDHIRQAEVQSDARTGSITRLCLHTSDGKVDVAATESGRVYAWLKEATDAPPFEEQLASGIARALGPANADVMVGDAAASKKK